MTPAVRAALKACWHAFLDEQADEQADEATFDKAWGALVSLVGAAEADRLWQIDRTGDDDFL